MNKLYTILTPFLFVCFASCTHAKKISFDPSTVDSSIAFRWEKDTALLGLRDGFIFNPLSEYYADSIIKSYGFRHTHKCACVEVIDTSQHPKIVTWCIDYVIGIEGDDRDNWVKVFADLGIIKIRLDTLRIKFEEVSFGCNLPVSYTPEPIKVNHKKGISSIQEFQVKSEILKTAAKGFLMDYYKPKGKLDVVENGQGYKFTINKLSKEVIYDHDYWEQVIIVVQVNLVQSNQSEIILNFEGYFQAHTGDEPNYEYSMEKKEFSKLFDY